MTTSKLFLLDANVLIALATPDHTAHERARNWFLGRPKFATCPITQGALIRFYFRWATRPSMEEAKALLHGFTTLAGHVFWPDDLSYHDVPGKGIIGHRHVTDAYLVELAARHKGSLATMDDGLARLHPSHVTRL